MTVKEYLHQAYLLDQRIKSDTLECEELREMAHTISSPGFEEHYNASKNTDAPYIHSLEKLWEMEESVLKEQALLISLKKQIQEVISSVERPEWQTVLRYRYIHNYSWTMIADLVIAGEKTVRRWHDQAVMSIELPKNAINLKDDQV